MERNKYRKQWVMVTDCVRDGKHYVFDHKIPYSISVHEAYAEWIDICASAKYSGLIESFMVYEKEVK